MEAKHTPGPWRVSADGVDVGSEDSFNPFGGCGCCGSPWLTADDPEVAKADARLIAAAPELLEACQAMIEWDDREQDHAVDFSACTELCRVAFDKARAAIAKATQ